MIRAWQPIPMFRCAWQQVHRMAARPSVLTSDDTRRQTLRVCGRCSRPHTQLIAYSDHKASGESVIGLLSALAAHTNLGQSSMYSWRTVG